MEITKELAEKLGISKENATEEDIVAAFDGIKTERDKVKADYDKDKRILSDRNSEIAKLKKEADARKTDEEKKLEHTAELEKQVAELTKQNKRNEIKTQYLAGGFNDDEAGKVADAMIEGKYDEVAKLTNEHTARVKKEVEAELAKKTPKPGGTDGDGNDDTLFTKDNFKAGKIPMEKLTELQKQNPEKYNEITK